MGLAKIKMLKNPKEKSHSLTHLTYQQYKSAQITVNEGHNTIAMKNNMKGINPKA